MRAHPLGLTAHPEWSKVRQRVTENAIAQQRAYQAGVTIGHRLATIAAGFMPFVLGAVFWWAL